MYCSWICCGSQWYETEDYLQSNSGWEAMTLGSVEREALKRAMELINLHLFADRIVISEGTVGGPHPSRFRVRLIIKEKVTETIEQTVLKDL